MINAEICCGSHEDALASYKGGAKRIELNSALYMGGLTPSLASLQYTKANTDLKVICMIRPRGAGFCYNEIEKEIMLADAKILMDNKSDGISFGFLNENSEIDVEATKKMVDLVHSYNGEAVFHRAFDLTKDPYSSIETLIDLGVDRILTAGQQTKVELGIDLIKELQEKYGDKIQILPGSGITSENVEDIVKKTGVKQVHSSCKGYGTDPTTYAEKLDFAYTSDKDSQFEIVLEERVKTFVNKTNNL